MQDNIHRAYLPMHVPLGLSMADLFSFITCVKSGLHYRQHRSVWPMLPNTLNSANLPCTASSTRLYTLSLIYVCAFLGGKF